MAPPNTHKAANTKQDAEHVVSQLREIATSHLRSAFPYLKTAALDDILKDISAIEHKITAQDAVMAASKAKSCFTDLPAEIRTRIYELALISEHPIEVQNLLHYEFQDYHLVKATPRPSLLSANRQVRQEALPVYYGNNTFIATFHMQWDGRFGAVPGSVDKWCRTIGKKQIAMMSKLEMRFPELGAASIYYMLPIDAIQAFAKAQGLRPDYYSDNPIQRAGILQALKMHSSGLREIKVLSDGRQPGGWIELMG